MIETGLYAMLAAFVDPATEREAAACMCACQLLLEELEADEAPASVKRQLRREIVEVRDRRLRERAAKQAV